MAVPTEVDKKFVGPKWVRSSPTRDHAILVLAHGDLTVLATLMEILDDDAIDFYVHVDASTKEFDPTLLLASLRRSRLFLPARRQAVSWGASTIVEVTLRLIAAAKERGYRHYHLVSGADLPLVTAQQFKDFFRRNPNVEWVGADAVEQKRYAWRVRYYFPMQTLIGRGERLHLRVLRRSQMLSGVLQRHLRVDRTAHLPDGARYGTQWFSITDGLATHIVENANYIMRLTRWTICGDEHFLQTLVQASPYEERRAVGRRSRSHSEQALRAIDWERGSPYVYRKNDVAALLDSDCVFARKFDLAVDPAAVAAIRGALLSAN